MGTVQRPEWSGLRNKRTVSPHYLYEFLHANLDMTESKFEDILTNTDLSLIVEVPHTGNLDYQQA
jgi:hypothetical protein